MQLPRILRRHTRRYSLLMIALILGAVLPTASTQARLPVPETPGMARELASVQAALPPPERGALAPAGEGQPSDQQPGLTTLTPQEAQAQDPEAEVRVLLVLDDGAPAVSPRGASDPARVHEQRTATRRTVLDRIRARGLASRVHHEFGTLLNGLSLSTRRRHWDALAELPGVRGVYPDRISQLTLSTSVPLIGAPTVWGLQSDAGLPVTGTGMRVAVIDSGIDYTHPDLGGCLGPACAVVGGYDFVNADADPMDDNGHGTHVAGIIAARGTLRGVAPGASLLAYKVCGASGGCYDSHVLAALERAANPDGDLATNDAVDVVNMSLAAGTTSSPLNQAVDNAVQRGMIVVVAAGNSGRAGYQTLNSPGYAEQAITVGATSKADALADFSSKGPALDRIKPDLLAPGVAISSTVPAGGTNGHSSRYRALDGTSMATPHVAGAAALLKQLHPDWTPAMVKASLMGSALDLGLSPHQQGAGRLQLAHAAAAPLLLSQGSIAVQAPALPWTTSIPITVTSVTTREVSASATITSLLWSRTGKTPLSPPQPVSFARLSTSEVTVPAGGASALALLLDLPADAPGGYYTGKITLQGAGFRLTLPFAFTILTRVTIHIRTHDGGEVPPYHRAVVAMVDLADMTRYVEHEAGATLVVPPGAYHVYGFAYHNPYDHIISTAPLRVPLLLSTRLDVGQPGPIDLWLDTSQARKYTIPTTTFAGDPLWVNLTTIYHYARDGVEYTLPVGTNMIGFTTAEYRKPLPKAIDLYISNTQPDVSVSFGIRGFGYTPAMQHFVDLNKQRWLNNGPQLGFNPDIWADEVHLVEWRLPALTDATPTLFGYDRTELREYDVTTDLPSTIREIASTGGVDTGRMMIDYLPGGPNIFAGPAMHGIRRTLYVRGAYHYSFWPGDYEQNLQNSLGLYSPSWEVPKALDQYPGVYYLEDPWPLQHQPGPATTIRLGAGPFFPSMQIDNTATELRVHAPIISSGPRTQAYWTYGAYTRLAIDKTEVIGLGGIESRWVPAVQWKPAPSGARRYKVRFGGASRLTVSTRVDGEANFFWPANDSDPPHVLELQMRQRFTPQVPLTVTLVVSDASALKPITAELSLDRGATWQPLAVTTHEREHSVVVSPASAPSISLRYVLADVHGNELSFKVIDAAVRETPVSLDVTVSPQTIPLTGEPVTVHISGTLRAADGAPLGNASVAIPIYLGDQLVGYARDLVKRADGTLTRGTFDADWTFIPLDFATTAGPQELRLVFDLGTYARQERRIRLDLAPVPPTPTATETSTTTATATETSPPTETRTPSATATATETSSPTETRTPSATATATETSPPTETRTPSSTATATSTPPAIAPNLIHNGAMEIDANGDGKVDSWTAGLYVRRSSAARHGGSYAMRHYAQGDVSYRISQTVTGITGLRSYSFVAWTNIPPTRDAFSYRLELQWLSDSGTLLRTDLVKEYTAPTAGWVRASTLRTAPRAARQARVRMSIAGLAATIYADDFVLR